MTKPAKKRYEVQIAGDWIRCRVGNELPRGWLEYATYDGTTGLARPGTWREAADKERARR